MAVIVAVRGHGNGDSGTVAPDGTREADVAAAIEERFTPLAMQAGHTVYRLQGTPDTLNGLSGFAYSVNADVVIEFHLDHQPENKNKLLAVLHPYNTKALALAGPVLEAVSAATGITDKGVYERWWGRLNDDLAHIIFEFGNLWNNDWRARLRDPATLEACAYGLLMGIHNYLQLAPPPPPVKRIVRGSPVVGFMATVVLGVGLYYGAKYLARKGVIPEFDLRASIASAGRKVVETVRKVVRR